MGAAQDSTQIAPTPDFDEFAIGAADFDLTSIGGYPVRKIQVVSGTGTVKVKTRGSGTTYRTWSGVSAGSELSPVEVFAIAGTNNGSSGGLTLRIFR